MTTFHLLRLNMSRTRIYGVLATDDSIFSEKRSITSSKLLYTFYYPKAFLNTCLIITLSLVPTRNNQKINNFLRIKRLVYSRHNPQFYILLTFCQLLLRLFLAYFLLSSSWHVVLHSSHFHRCSIQTKC